MRDESDSDDEIDGVDDDTSDIDREEDSEWLRFAKNTIGTQVRVMITNGMTARRWDSLESAFSRSEYTNDVHEKDSAHHN